MGPWGEFITKIYFMISYAFLVFLLLFHNKIGVFIIFISFFDKILNFRNRVLTIQKNKLVVCNC